MNGQFPEFGSGSLTSARARNVSLNFDLGSLLGDEKSSRPSSSAAKSVRSAPRSQNPKSRIRTGGEKKRVSLRQDDDFDAHLATEAGRNDDEDVERVTEEDALKMGSSLADMDDLDDSLFSSSLSRSSRQSRRTKRRETTKSAESASAKQLEDKPAVVEVERKQQPKANEKKSTGSLFDDIDDPFAGILSSDEEEKDTHRSRSGAGGKRSVVDGRRDAVGEKEQVRNEEVIHEDATSKQQSSSLLSQMSPKLRRAALGDSEATTSSNVPNLPNEPLQHNPPTSKPDQHISSPTAQHSQPRSSTIINTNPKVTDDPFSDNDDDDLLGDLGFDSSPPTQTKPKDTNQDGKRFSDILGKSSRFDELMGKTDDNTATTDSTRTNQIERPRTRGKSELDAEPGEADDVHFGGYTPSFGAPSRSRQQGSSKRQRPSTAPSASAKSKSVRFADELGLELDDEDAADHVTRDRPSSSPAQVTGKGRRREVDVVTFDGHEGNTELGAGGVTKTETKDRERDTSMLMNRGGMSSVSHKTAENEVLTLAERDSEVSEGRDTVDGVGRRLESAVDDGDLFGGDMGLGLSSGERPLMGRRRQQEEKPLFPWQSPTSRRQGRRQPGTALSIPEDTTSNAINNNNNTTVKHMPSAPTQPTDPIPYQEPQPLATTGNEVTGFMNSIISTQPQLVPVVSPAVTSSGGHQHSDVSQQSLTLLQSHPTLTGVLPSQLTTRDLSVSGVALSLSHAEASAVAIANANAEGRQAVLREEIEKLRSEVNTLKAKINDLEDQCSHHEKEWQTLQKEKDLLSQKLEEKEEQAQKDSREKKLQETEFETKIHIAEVAKKQLQDALIAATDRHKQELENLETVTSSRIKSIEESFERQESRLRNEIEKQATEHNRKVIELEKGKSSVVTTYERKLADADREHMEAIERLKETHRSLIEELKIEHDKDKNRQHKLHEHELTAVAQAHSHTRSLQELISQVHQSTQHVSELQQRVDVSHNVGHQQREQALRIREQQLQGLEERLLRQQSECEQERSRLHNLVAKMESHMREQTHQIEQDRWKIQQDESRLQALQRALEHDRVTTAEHITQERQELQQAREQMLKEQQVVLSQCYAERSGLAKERSQLQVTQRLSHHHELENATKSVQLEAELRNELERVQQQSEDLAASQSRVRNELERLRDDRKHVDLEKRSLHNEKDALQQTRLKLQENTKELQQLYSSAAEAREIGKQSLHEAELMKADVERRACELEDTRRQLDEQKRKIVQEQLEISRERMSVEKGRNSWLQERSLYLSQKDQASSTVPSLPPQPRFISTLALRASRSRHPTDEPEETPTGHDLTSSQATSHAIAQLEYNRALRLWANANEKQVEELHEETNFLDALETSKTSNKTTLIL